MKKILYFILTTIIIVNPMFVFTSAQLESRKEIRIPDILGYQTLKCDFHIHTVFSDGNVWPTVRAEEAWREGLDVIAITDHIEYLPHKKDMIINFNRSYEITEALANQLGVVVIRGGEITRGMPPGHFNAIFMDDVAELDNEDWHDSFEKASEQGAFIFWNHPGWEGQQPDGLAKWYKEHTWLFENNKIHGMEIVNEREYYPEVFKWCLEKGITLMSNSDIHNPMGMDYDFSIPEHRPVTLVFAEEKSKEAIKKALFEGRTVAYSGNNLYGNKKYLKAIFTESISLDKTALELIGNESKYIQITNNSDISYELSLTNEIQDLSLSKGIILHKNRTVLLRIRANEGITAGTKLIKLNYGVNNLKTTPNKSLEIEFEIKVDFQSE